MALFLRLLHLSSVVLHVKGFVSIAVPNHVVTSNAFSARAAVKEGFGMIVASNEDFSSATDALSEKLLRGIDGSVGSQVVSQPVKEISSASTTAVIDTVSKSVAQQIDGKASTDAVTAVVDTVSQSVKSQITEQAPIDLTAIDWSSLPPTAIIGCGLALAIAVVVASSKSDSGDGPKRVQKSPPEPVFDVSIPYDAAAQLAFRKAQGVEKGEYYFAEETIDEAEFAKFKESYVKESINMVIAKKRARDRA